GLQAIARRVADTAGVLARGLRAVGVEVVHGQFFDTVLTRVPDRAAGIVQTAREKGGVNLRLVDADHVAVACDETTTGAHLDAVLSAFGADGRARGGAPDPGPGPWAGVPRRTSAFLQHEAFVRYRTETAMMRYLRQRPDKDMALDRSMIPLGSCTMKLNSAVEMAPITWPGFADTHPFVPADQARGTLRIVADLERWLAAITGYDAVSVQP